MKQRLILLYILTITLTACPFAKGQMQLVLLRNEKVLLRLNPGDDFIYRLKNSKSVRNSYVNNLSDTSVTAHNDVVPFYTIDRLYFSRTTFLNRIGRACVVGGGLLFLIDEINVGIVKNEGFSFDSGVSTVSLSLIGAGLPMMLIRKKSQRIKGKYRLRMVKKGSPFYQGDLNGM